MNHADTMRKQAAIYGYIVILINLAIMTKWIGFVGLTYFLIALLTVYLFISIAAVGVCDTMGKQIRLRNSKEQFGSAAALSKNLIIYQLVKGALLWGIAAAVCDTLLRDYLKVPYAISVFYILSPVIMLRSLNEGMKGALKGEGKDALLMIVEFAHQVVILGLSLLFGFLLKEKGIKVSNLLGQDTFSYMYGGIGIAIAIAVSEVVLTVIYLMLCLKEYAKKSQKFRNGMRTNDVFWAQLITVFKNRVNGILCSVLIILPLMAAIYYCLNREGVDIAVSQAELGTVVYSVLLLTGVLICYVVVRVVVVYNRSCVAMKKNESRMARTFFRCGVQITSTRAIFLTMFMFFMSQNFSNILMGEMAELGGTCLKYCAFLILPVSLCFYFTGICNLSGKKMLVVFSLFVSAIVMTCIILFKRDVADGFALSILLALVVAAYICVFVLGSIVFGLFKQGLDVIQFIIFPIVSALLVGILCIILQKMLTPHIGEPLMLLVSFVVSCSLYWVVLLFLHCFRSQDLEVVPGGKLILAAGQMLHVL